MMLVCDFCLFTGTVARESSYDEINLGAKKELQKAMRTKICEALVSL